MTFYEKSTLSNGVRVITESIPHVRSASVGVWVKAGSVFETSANMGISHLIEHLLFKGTERRTAREIAQAIDGRGGSLNAFTAKEHTCYYSKVLDEHLPIALDVLADMLQGSLFAPDDIAKEKGVVLEEIKMYEDVPDDLVHDLHSVAMWEEHALGRPIVGTEQTVQDMSREALLGYLGERYVSGNLVVAAAGRLEHGRVVEMVERLFGRVPSAPGDREWPAPPAPLSSNRAIWRQKETEQVHMVIGMPGLNQDHEDLYALHLMNTVLGGGASSRLFQEIREERGLAYSVYSYQSTFRKTGSFGVYAGTSPGAAEQVLSLIGQEMEKVGRHGITAQELAEAKEQLKGQIMLGLESTSGRMTRLGRGELVLGRVLSPDDVIHRIDSVTLEQVASLTERLFCASPRVLSMVGPTADRFDFAGFGFAEVRHG